VLVIAQDARVEAPLEEVAGSRVAFVEPLRIDAVDALHGTRDRFDRAFEDRVEVIRHEAERVALEALAHDGLTEQGHEEPMVFVVDEDRAAVHASRRHVVDGGAR
jgi:hypothetical protein